MPFYTGTTADGSDMVEVEGVYQSPDGREWSNEPYDETWRPTTRRERRQRERDAIKQQQS